MSNRTISGFSSLTSSRSRIIDNALDAVGQTPLIRLDKIAKQEGLQCNLRMSHSSDTLSHKRTPDLSFHS